MRFPAFQCRRLPHRILHQFRTGFRTTLFRLSEVLFPHLMIVLSADLHLMADPLGHHKLRLAVIDDPFGFACCPHVLERLVPRREVRSGHDAAKLCPQICPTAPIPSDDEFVRPLAVAEGAQQMRHQIIPDRHEPQPAAAMVFCLDRVNLQLCFSPKNIAPLQAQDFRGTPQGPEPSQGDDKPPLRVRAGRQERSRFFPRDVVVAFAVDKIARLDASQGILNQQPSLNGRLQELLDPPKLSVCRCLCELDPQGIHQLFRVSIRQFVKPPVPADILDEGPLRLLHVVDRALLRIRPPGDVLGDPIRHRPGPGRHARPHQASPLQYTIEIVRQQLEPVNLRTAGVQNTFKGERLKFDTLEPFAGQWIHGRGEYTEKDGKRRRVAVCIGPEHGTVGPGLVKEAAKEVVQGVGFDVLIVCGFAFDPHVSEEAKRYGKLVVLPTRMNPDLAMGDLLKKTGSANLFMVFGEPDVEVKKTKDGQVTAKINGLDVYDPTTGEIRSSSTDDIACWFIDTNYNGESFFVRHAYFTGADEPYEKLKRALRAEVDEAAWSALYSTTSRPFPAPETGKIAIKVINHYGDEVLKVYEVRG